MFITVRDTERPPPPTRPLSAGALLQTWTIVHRPSLVETRVNADHRMGRNCFSRKFLHKTASHFRRIFSTHGKKRTMATRSSCENLQISPFSKLHPKLSLKKPFAKLCSQCRTGVNQILEVTSCLRPHFRLTRSHKTAFCLRQNAK